MNLIHGDCLEKLKEIADGSVDMVLADLPYGTTACKWDTRIPFEPLWEQLHRVCKPNAAMAMFGSEPFSSLMRMSNLKRFKYDWVWEKEKGTMPMQAPFRPIGVHEIVSVFSVAASTFSRSGSMKYYPIKISGKPYKKSPRKPGHMSFHSDPGPHCRENLGDRFPRTVLRFKTERGLHPTQKPVALLEYLIKTYTNEGDTVLDPTMGSGSTGVACCNLKRHFIGIEKELNYFEIAQKRIG